MKIINFFTDTFCGKNFVRVMNLGENLRFLVTDLQLKCTIVVSTYEL